ncbi:MAG: hypothetical protein ABIR18_09075 [Chitinophagaceae bacterium]
MTLSFISNEADRCHMKARMAEAAYREAIRKNKEFSETKKLYQEYKRIEKELELIVNKKPFNGMRISFR